MREHCDTTQQADALILRFPSFRHGSHHRWHQRFQNDIRQSLRTWKSSCHYGSRVATSQASKSALLKFVQLTASQGDKQGRWFYFEKVPVSATESGSSPHVNDRAAIGRLSSRASTHFKVSRNCLALIFCDFSILWHLRERHENPNAYG